MSRHLALKEVAVSPMQGPWDPGLLQVWMQVCVHTHTTCARAHTHTLISFFSSFPQLSPVHSSPCQMACPGAPPPFSPVPTCHHQGVLSHPGSPPSQENRRKAGQGLLSIRFDFRCGEPVFPATALTRGHLHSCTIGRI